MTRLVAACIAAGVVLATPRAYAQDANESPAIAEARQRFTVATELFDSGNYAGALREWQTVYQLMESHPNRAQVLFNIGRAYQELGQARQALAHFRRYLAETPGDAPHRATAQQIMRELELRLELQREGGQDSGGFSPAPIGIAIGVTGVAAIIAGSVLGGMALAMDSSGRAQCQEGRCTEEAYATVVDAHMYANVADVLLWSGIGLAAAGTIVAIVLGDSPDNARGSASCTSDGCVVVLGAAF